ncbi:MAG TPA: hypothetical protein VGN26_06775 [Armatimonadota bacterium]
MRPGDALMLKDILALGESAFSLADELQVPLDPPAPEVPVLRPGGSPTGEQV